MNLRKSISILFFIAIITFESQGQEVLKSAVPKEAKVSFSRLERIDLAIEEAIKKKEMGGAIGMMVRDGKIVYQKAFGYSDQERRNQLQTNDIFRIASQTKAITSVAVMMLFEEGKFLLDDPVSKYIPAFSKPTVVKEFNATDSSYTTVPATREIRIRDLLTHTSGIDYALIGSSKMKAIYAKNGLSPGFGSDQLLLKDQILKLARLPLSHQPGEKFTYGLNTDVLGYLVEVISGTTLDQFFLARIFKPLGMNDTHFYLPSSKFSRLVQVQNSNAQGKEPIETNYPKVKGTYFSGGAGLSSTIYDYAVFLQMLLNGGTYNGQRLLSRRSIDLMTMNQIGEIPLQGDQFGLGFKITSEQSMSKLGVTKGSFAWGGYFGTTYWVDPAEKIIGLIYIQQSALKSDIHDKFKALVYQSLED